MAAQRPRRIIKDTVNVGFSSAWKLPKKPGRGECEQLGTRYSSVRMEDYVQCGPGIDDGCKDAARRVEDKGLVGRESRGF